MKPNEDKSKLPEKKSAANSITNPKKERSRAKKSTANVEEVISKKAIEAVPLDVDENGKNHKNTRTRRINDKAKPVADSVTEMKIPVRKRKATLLIKEEGTQEAVADTKTEENCDLYGGAPPKKKQSTRSKNVKASVKLEPVASKNEKSETAVLMKIEKPFCLGRKYVGGHTSIAGGLENSVIEATKMGGTAFAMFVRSQRQWNCKPMEEAAAQKFRETLVEHDFSPHVVLPHGSYLLNCGAPNPETLEKSRAGLIDELQRCERLGLILYNFHPGSTCGKISIDECLSKIAESINQAHAKTKHIITVVENMSRQGHTIGGDFQELRGIIDKVKDKSRIGVCIDTCHAFAAGYDLATETGYNLMMEDFEKYIGFEYLKGLHLNDSKDKVGCHKDRHENIGKGHIGIEGFRRIMNEPRFNDIPMILETPWISNDIYMKEVKLLNSLIVT